MYGWQKSHEPLEREGHVADVARGESRERGAKIKSREGFAEIRQTRWGEMGGVRKSSGERGESEDHVDGRVRVQILRARGGKVDGEGTKRKADGKEEADDRGGRLRVQVRRKRQTIVGGGQRGSCLLREVVRCQPSVHDGVQSLVGRKQGSGSQGRYFVAVLRDEPDREMGRRKVGGRTRQRPLVGASDIRDGVLSSTRVRKLAAG